jgi:dipeptidyl aminopeptidase/acylaminoacyl peptidase
MTAQNDLDRILFAWFHGDATTTPPAEPLARAIESTRTVRPRMALVARVGSSWVGADGARGASARHRPAFGVALAVLLVLALVGGAMLVGSRLFSQPFKPTPFLTGNGVIAVAKDGDIFVADRPGGDLRPLLTGPEDDTDPLFSPDGTKLAFLRDGALMLADADGTNVVQVASGPIDFGRWRFSPDGRSVVGISGSALEDGTHRVAVLPVDPAAELINLDIALHDGGEGIVEWGGPEFRPTNPQEILIVGTLQPEGPRGIYVYDLATNAIRTVLEPAGYLHDVVWTPDGASITYDLTDQTRLQARVIAADGSGDRPLLNAPGTKQYHRVSRWSNDGTRTVIAILGHEQLVVSTSGDGMAVEIACPPRGEGSDDIVCPDLWIWSPDDSMLVGTFEDDIRGMQTFLADPATGVVTKLDWDVGLDDPQAWQRVAP